jgi:glycosyltransferase involved in cell wall biosynthesis
MIKSEPSITIAIPTYNRVTSVLTTISALTPIFGQSNLQILVIDNGSTDDTYRVLSKSFSQIKNFTVIRYDDNFGFLESFLRLFDNCTSEYLFLLSDEDQVHLEAIPAFSRFIEKNHPGFISTDFYNSEGFYRGSQFSRKITYSEIEKSAFYISGLVFKTKVSQGLVSEIREELKGNEFIYLYPQTYLAFRLRMISTAYWYGDVVSFERDQLPSTVVNELGEPYATTEARINQHHGWEKMVLHIISHSKHEFSKRDLFEIQAYSFLRRQNLKTVSIRNSFKPWVKFWKMQSQCIFYLRCIIFARKLYWFTLRKLLHFIPRKS